MAHATLKSDPLGFLARVGLVAMIVAMLLLPYSYRVDPTGAGLKTVLAYSNFFWAGYITVEVLESAQRDFTAAWAWVLDSLLAVGALVVGFEVFTGTLSFSPLTFDQRHLLSEALLWTAVDLITGLLIPFVIAGSIKNRKETEAK